MLNCRS